jgi:homoserine kinase type II
MVGPLTELLSRYPIDCQPLPASIPEALGSAGGLSGASLWRYESLRGPLGLRAGPEQGRSLADIRRIHAWLAQAAALSFVPVPIAASRGETASEWCGRIWELAPWMPGQADRSIATPPPTRVTAVFRALANFHVSLAAVSAAGQSAGLAARASELEYLWAGGGLEAIGKRLSAASLDPVWGIANSWWMMAVEVVPRLLAPVRRAAAQTLTLQPCLRDARPDHFLFVDDRITGLVDFGAMDLDTVTADLGRLRSDWDGLDHNLRALGLAAYTAVRPLDAEESRLIDVFEQSAAVLGGARWIRWHYSERRVFSDPSAVERGLARAVDRLARLATRGL